MMKLIIPVKTLQKHLTPVFKYAYCECVFFFFSQALNFLVESFGLLNDLFPLPSILDAGYPVFIFIWQMSSLMLFSHLYLGFLLIFWLDVSN